MSAWDDFWNAAGQAVEDGAEAVGDFVEGTVNAVAETVSDVVETVSNAAADVLDWIGGDGPLSDICGWLAGIITSGVRFFIINSLKGALNLIGGLIGGIIKVIGGFVGALMNGNWSVFFQGLIDIASTIVGIALAWVLMALAVVQSVLPFANERALTKEEKAILKQVFRGSLALYNIRLKNTTGVQGIVTMPNYIYCKDLYMTKHLLVHECVHIWQYQHFGPRYLADAIGSWIFYSREACKTGNAYDWKFEFINRGNKKWEKWNVEAMAEIINNIWTDGTITRIPTDGSAPVGPDDTLGAFYQKPLDPPDSSVNTNVQFIYAKVPRSMPGRFDPSATEDAHCAGDDKDYSDLATEVVGKLRGSINFRLSQFIPN